MTNPSAAFYGVGGARISSQDGATVRLDATGAVFCHSGVTEQGQGAESVLAQCVATSFGVPIERVRVITGDTDNTPYGGGTWASRAAGIGGEAAWQAGKALRDNVLAAAASILQADPKALDIRAGIVVDADTGRERMGLDEVARVVYFRPDTLPPGFQAEFTVTRHYVPRAWPFAFTNGVQASYLDVDIRTGEIKLLKHWCVEDCGTVINPQLVDEQIRGGIVQGIGAVLFEHCLYDDAGQLLNGNLMDYLVPMAGEMPDIDIGHVVTPTARFRARRQGRGRSRHRRRAGLRHERGQRCAPPARRRADHGDADHAGARAASVAARVIHPYRLFMRGRMAADAIWSAATPESPPRPMSPDRKPKIVAMIVGSAIIMQQIDSTVITTALPQMAISLHTDPVRLSVAVTAYLLSLAVFVPVSGWAAERFGGRTVFRAAIALFTLGSILCGLSDNVDRADRGAGAARASAAP